MAYIYQIINDVNGKIYIGKTEFDIQKRFKEHCKDAFKERNEKRPLYAAMRKYGIEHFHIELLEETDNPEEREIYWIEQKHSFKSGYNATIGGDGKRYLDYDLIISTYNKVKNIKEVARYCNVHPDSVRHILRQNSIPIYSSNQVLKQISGKCIGAFSLKNNELIQSFSSILDGARWCYDNKYSQSTNLKGIAAHIGAVCNGKRKTCYGFIWKYL